MEKWAERKLLPGAASMFGPELGINRRNGSMKTFVCGFCLVFFEREKHAECGNSVSVYRKNQTFFFLNAGGGLLFLKFLL